MEELKIIYKRVGELIPYDKNPRNNKEAVQYVANSIKAFGFKNPIIIDKDNVIVCGHTRLLGAKKLNIDKVPCIYANDLTDEQIRAFRLADNKVSEVAEWDMKLLSNELEDILNIDMSIFDFKDVLEDVIDFSELEQENEKKGNVIVSLNIPNIANWNLIENEIKRIVEQADGTVAIKLQ